ncbi:MAG: hypothetical protein GY716_23075 [bacterium]|nr:hypothetical protein [bacterium]
MVVSSFTDAPSSFGQPTGPWEVTGTGAGTVTFGTCIDPDTDDDGVDDADDTDPSDPNVCRDVDGDTCDDCTNTGADQSGGDVSNDGLDTDSDGACDTGDTDDDNDGVDDGDDTAPLNPNVCRDVDGDTCDDCSLTGANQSGGDVANDGLDTDSDGACDAGDADDDNDGVDDGDDTDPLDANVCRDADGDTCDDCALTGADQSGGDIANDGDDTDTDGICDLGDRLDFSVAQIQIVNPILYPQNVYHDDPPAPGGGIAQAFPSQLPGSTNLDALDVINPDTYKFSVTSPAIVFTSGGAVILSPANVYVRSAGGAITVDLNWAAEGINLQSLNAVDMIDADTYLFSVAQAQVVIDGVSAFLLLRPSGVYRYDRTTGAIDEVLDATPLGMSNVDGVDQLPDGRIALSAASQGIAQLPGGLLLIHPAIVYITDPADATPNLIEAYDGPAAGLLTIDGFTAIVPEAP